MTCRSCEQSRTPCRDAFRRGGIHTVHWECWSDCNLRCDFCYRSLRKPLETHAAAELVEAIAHGGATRLIFAGGDPSLRPDLGQLCRRAVELNLVCEIQTNGQAVTPSLAVGLSIAGRLYLSLDGASAATHDSFRAKRGSFAGVARLLRMAEKSELPVTVHSVASRKNCRELPEILAHIQRFSCVDTWSVLQFSPIGAGYRTRREHELSAHEWQLVSEQLRSLSTARPRFVPLGVNQKTSLYALVSADGYAYRAGDPTSGPIPDQWRIGPIRTAHLPDIVAGWRIDPDRHGRRYADDLAGLL